MSKTSNPPRPVVLCIMDGWGHRTDRDDNAVALAKKYTLEICLYTHTLANA